MVKRISVRKRKVSKARRRSGKRKVSKTRRRSSKRKVSKTRRRSSKRKVSKTRRRSGKRRVSRRKQQRGGGDPDVLWREGIDLAEKTKVKDLIDLNNMKEKLITQLESAKPVYRADKTLENGDTRTEALIKAENLVAKIKQHYEKYKEPRGPGQGSAYHEEHPYLDWGESELRLELLGKIEQMSSMRGVSRRGRTGRGNILRLISAA